ncbi:unnamed protein product [Ambrosiozyma monospora]|uniref:Unnamed protein product n=1 Tax=Ambrosiozyma monospora TaxID=43982 RepID=A0ACB5U6I4_AMBMO|nr:unnamed protein product [Ambrosiozyma monospora]
MYLNELVTVMGGLFTKSLTPDNTHLLVAKPFGKKFEACQSWGINTVNHLWLEDSYAKWEFQDENSEKYKLFPRESNLTEIIGKTPIDLNVIREKFVETDDHNVQKEQAVAQKEDNQKAQEAHQEAQEAQEVQEVQEVKKSKRSTGRRGNKKQKPAPVEQNDDKLEEEQVSVSGIGNTANGNVGEDTPETTVEADKIPETVLPDKIEKIQDDAMDIDDSAAKEAC